MIKPRRGGENALQGQLSQCTTRSCITSFFCLQEAQSFSVYIFVKTALQLGLRRNPICRFLSSHTVTYFDASTKAQHMKMGQLYNHQAPLSTGQRCPKAVPGGLWHSHRTCLAAERGVWCSLIRDFAPLICSGFLRAGSLMERPLSITAKLLHGSPLNSPHQLHYLQQYLQFLWIRVIFKVSSNPSHQG